MSWMSRGLEYLREGRGELFDQWDVLSGGQKALLLGGGAFGALNAAAIKGLLAAHGRTAAGVASVKLSESGKAGKLSPYLPLISALQFGGAAGVTAGKLMVAAKAKKRAQEFYDLVQGQAKTGMGSDYSRLLALGESRIARQGGQDRMAASLASRGVSDSSEANAFLAGSAKTRMEAFNELQSQLIQLDEQIKQQAQAQLPGLSENLAQAEQQANIPMAVGDFMSSLGMSAMTVTDLAEAKKMQEDLMRQVMEQYDRRTEALNKIQPVDPMDEMEEFYRRMMREMFPESEQERRWY